MSTDYRQSLDDTPITGISERIDQLVNERFRTLAQAVLQLQARTLLEPLSVAPVRAYDGQLVFANGVNWSPDNTGLPGVYYYYNGQWHQLLDNSPGNSYMQWGATWTPGLYRQWTMVTDEGWLMVANKDTNEKPAPVPNGPPLTDLPDTPAWAYQQHVGVIWSGTDYTFTQGGWVESISVWAPTFVGSPNYRILIVDATDPDQLRVSTIEEPVLNEDAWTIIGLGAKPVAAGQRFLIILDALNSGGSQEITGGWQRGGNQNTAPPVAGQWNRRNQNDVVRIHHDDLDTVDRQSELESIIPGSTIQFANTDNNAQSVTYYVNSVVFNVDHVHYDVTISDTGVGGEPGVGATCQMTASIPLPVPTDYVDMVGYWPGNQPAFATASGVLELSGVPQTVPNNAYGVRIGFQPADVSTDWDYACFEDLGATSSTNVMPYSMRQRVRAILGV